MLGENTAKSESSNDTSKPFKLWMHKRVVFTADAIIEPYGQKIYDRVMALTFPVELAKNNRITGLSGKDERECPILMLVYS